MLSTEPCDILVRLDLLLVRSVDFGSASVGDTSPCFIVFEAGPTHDGVKTAMRLVDEAALAGAQAIKFQIFNADELVADKCQTFAYSVLKDKVTGELENIEEPLYDILRRRQLTKDEWFQVKSRADSHGLAFFATIGFESDLELLRELNCDSVKIASADVDHFPLLRLAARSGMSVQIDTGNADIEEIKRAVDVLESEGCYDIIIHQCPSGYPARLPSICLNMISTLRSTFPRYPIAYSDHTPEADMDIAAVAIGANLIEKTITLDRCTRSVEHVFSLEPCDMKSFISRIRDVEVALGSDLRVLNDEQKNARKLLRRSPYLLSSAPVGTPISSLKIRFSRPGLGLTPPEWESLLQQNAKLSVDLHAGQMILSEHLS